MGRAGRVVATVACALAVIVPPVDVAAAAPFTASPVVDLLDDAFDALMRGDDDAYAATVSAIESSGEWLPEHTWAALDQRDDTNIALSSDLLAAPDDRELMVSALNAITWERDAVRLATGGPAVDRLYAERMDDQGLLVLEVIDHRGVVLQDSTRALLGPFDPARLDRLLDVTDYEDVIGVLAGRLGITLPPGDLPSMDPALVTSGPTASDPSLDEAGQPVTGDDPAVLVGPAGSVQAAEPDGALGSSGLTPITTGVAVLALAGLGFSVASWRRGRRHDRLADLAYSDALTGLSNRRRFDDDLVEHAGQRDRPTAVLMLDVDHFKRFNDTYGHAAGDEVLRQVGDVITRHVRSDDVAYRYGGEEFSVLLPGATIEEARTVGLRLGEAIRELRIETADGGTVSVTASIGLSRGPAEQVGDLVCQADEAMYAAKQTGRDRLVVSGAALSVV